MIWLLVLIVMLTIGGGLLASGRRSGPESYRTLVRLHRIRQGLNLANFKVEVRRDASRIRRELRAELERDDGP